MKNKAETRKLKISILRSFAHPFSMGGTGPNRSSIERIFRSLSPRIPRRLSESP